MPDRKIAADIREIKRDGGPSDYEIRLVPREPVPGLNADAIVLQLKNGATQAQVEKLQAMINLLAVELRLYTPTRTSWRTFC